MAKSKMNSVSVNGGNFAVRSAEKNGSSDGLIQKGLLTVLLVLSCAALVGCGEANRELSAQDSSTLGPNGSNTQSNPSGLTPAPDATPAPQGVAPSVTFFGYYETPFEVVWDAPLAQSADYDLQVCRLNTSLTTSPFQVQDETQCQTLASVVCEGRQSCIAIDESLVQDSYARLQSSAVSSAAKRFRYSNGKWAAVRSNAFIRIRARNSTQVGAWIAPTSCSYNVNGTVSGSKTCIHQ